MDEQELVNSYKTKYPAVVINNLESPNEQIYHDNITLLTSKHNFKPEKPMLDRFKKFLELDYGLTFETGLENWRYAGGMYNPDEYYIDEYGEECLNLAAHYHNSTHHQYLLNLLKIKGFNYQYVIDQFDGIPNKCVCHQPIKNVCLIANQDYSRFLVSGIDCIHQLDDFFQKIKKSNFNFKVKCLDCFSPLKRKNTNGKCDACNEPMRCYCKKLMDTSDLCKEFNFRPVCNKKKCRLIFSNHNSTLKQTFPKIKEHYDIDFPSYKVEKYKKHIRSLYRKVIHQFRKKVKHHKIKYVDDFEVEKHKQQIKQYTEKCYTILKWSGTQKYFNPSFVSSILRQIDFKNNITEKQAQCIDNIIVKWRIKYLNDDPIIHSCLPIKHSSICK